MYYDLIDNLDLEFDARKPFRANQNQITVVLRFGIIRGKYSFLSILQAKDVRVVWSSL